MNGNYWTGLAKETDKVFQSHPSLYDHRSQYPWLTGALGDPFAGIWFIAENPSLTQIERVQNPDGRAPTIEAQWWASRGDQLFREKLVKYGFKNGSIESPGDWNCYITNVIKEADYTKNWREKTQSARNQASEIWSGLLHWELNNSKPRLVVVVGNQPDVLLNHLVSIGKLKLPRVEKITHYAYIGQRAQGKLGPMHPLRVKEYDKEFARIREIFDELS
jgi:hypothetical protein